jgi:hypothetical protein
VLTPRCAYLLHQGKGCRRQCLPLLPPFHAMNVEHVQLAHACTASSRLRSVRNHVSYVTGHGIPVSAFLCPYAVMPPAIPPIALADIQTAWQQELRRGWLNGRLPEKQFVHFCSCMEAHAKAAVDAWLAAPPAIQTVEQLHLGLAHGFKVGGTPGELRAHTISAPCIRVALQCQHSCAVHDWVSSFDDDQYNHI